MDNRLSREDWLRAARLALIRGGPGAVRVEVLARRLRVTKGSFYWHFKDRDDLLNALLREWEEETETVFGELLARPSAHDALRYLTEYLHKSLSSPLGEYPPDFAILNWAATSPKVAKRISRIERQRIDTLTKITGRPDRVELAYLMWLGFIFRRHLAPATARDFPLIWAAILDLVMPPAEATNATEQPADA